MIPSRLIDYLDRSGARYELCPHDPSVTSLESARSAHVVPHQLAKSVLLEDDTGCVMALLPADKRLSVQELAGMLGRGDLHLATEDRIASVFSGCQRGALPGIAQPWGVETIVDDELESSAQVYLEAGDHEMLLKLSHEQFHELMRDARHGHFCSAMVH
jgi:Ala-tRNA(Pro) deacylase